MNTQACVDPDVVQTWELEAYANGEDLPHVTEHLKRCPACRTRVADYRILEKQLSQLLYRFDCPSPDQLRLYHEGELPAEEKARVRSHLQACPHCTLELASLIHALATAADSVWNEDMARALETAQRDRLSLAHLAEPASQSAPVLRGETREVLLFEVGEAALSLSLEQDETGAYALFGQLLLSEPLEAQESYARLRTSYTRSPTTVSAPLDANGSFALSNLSAGVYQLVIDVPDLHIVVPNLTLREAY